MTENREVKSDVFSMLMMEKKYALQVYNAVNNTNYENPEDIQIFRLEKGISLSMRNDASLILDMYLNIYEHQSTYSPNMPLRSLLYLAEMYKILVKDKDLYGRTLIKIPTPKFVVFYNGTEERPSVETLRLSDAFIHTTDTPDLELVCTVYNINLGKNGEFLKKCPVLAEYMQFIDEIRQNERTGDERPIEKAIDWCIEHDILREFLKERRSEVLKAMTIDMTFERREELIRRDERAAGREEGREEGLASGLARGREEGTMRTLFDLYQDGMITLDIIKAKTGKSDTEIEAALANYRN